MIKDRKAKDCVGLYATLDTDLMNGGGQCIAKGSKVRIRAFGRAFTIETERCPHCGQYSLIRGVTKNQLTLCEDQTK